MKREAYASRLTFHARGHFAQRALDDGFVISAEARFSEQIVTPVTPSQPQPLSPVLKKFIMPLDKGVSACMHMPLPSSLTQFRRFYS